MAKSSSVIGGIIMNGVLSRDNTQGFFMKLPLTPGNHRF